MKIRTDFVTNSSSASFVIVKSKLPEDDRERIIDIIETLSARKDIEEIMEEINSGDVENIYNLIDYDYNDDEMHIWVRRDESMSEEMIDILEGNDNENIDPKFEYHY